MPKRGLGKGLDSLIPHGTETGITRNQEVPIEAVKPNPWQPRREFPPESLRELADSIKQHGILQPVLVVELGNREYQLIAGERRLRAAKIAGLKDIPVVIGDFSEKKQLEIALVENLQREDLDPLEEASAFKRLMDEFGYTQEEVSRRVGKSRPAVANALRLLNLDPRVKAAIREGKISAGHARSLLAFAEGEKQWQEAEKIIKQKLTVRDSETLARRGKATKKEQTNPYIEDMQSRLRRILGTKIRIRTGKGGRGKIEIEYFSQEDLERLVELIERNVSRETGLKTAFRDNN